MLVQAASGIKVPMEFKSRDYITDALPVDVIDSAYYRRRISDGDLVIVVQATSAQAAKAVKESANG
jgi:hypothetical protein